MMGRQRIASPSYFMFCLLDCFKKIGVSPGFFFLFFHSCKILFLPGVEKEIHFEYVYIGAYLLHQKNVS